MYLVKIVDLSFIIYFTVLYITFGASFIGDNKRAMSTTCLLFYLLTPILFFHSFSNILLFFCGFSARLFYFTIIIIIIFRCFCLSISICLSKLLDFK